MDGQKVVLIATAIVALGIFVMPSTISLFSGQHYWYNISGRSNEVPCEKCHADIAKEMEQIGPHTGETGYRRLKCGYCHRAFKIEKGDTGGPYDWDQYPDVNLSLEAQYLYTYASGDGSGATPGKQSHAASTIPCMYCHSGGSQGIAANHWSYYSNCWSWCHWMDPQPPHNGRFQRDEECYRCHGNNPVRDVPPAGGFNLTANATDTGERAAHKTFVMNSISNPDMEDANEACIACHTGIPVQINWTHAMNLVLNATYIKSKKVPPTHFEAHNFSANGTVIVISYGNWSGGAKNGSWPSGDIDIWGYNKAP